MTHRKKKRQTCFNKQSKFFLIKSQVIDPMIRICFCLEINIFYAVKRTFETFIFYNQTCQAVTVLNGIRLI